MVASYDIAYYIHIAFLTIIYTLRSFLFIIRYVGMNGYCCYFVDYLQNLTHFYKRPYKMSIK